MKLPFPHQMRLILQIVFERPRPTSALTSARSSLRARSPRRSDLYHLDRSSVSSGRIYTTFSLSVKENFMYMEPAQVFLENSFRHIALIETRSQSLLPLHLQFEIWNWKDIAQYDDGFKYKIPRSQCNSKIVCPTSTMMILENSPVSVSSRK